MTWVAGEQLQGGKYTIEKELGRGRFGITYLAKEKKGDRLVIKTLNDALLNSLSQHERDRLESMFWQENETADERRWTQINLYRIPKKSAIFKVKISKL